MSENPRLHIVLFEPEIPQNTGNVARTCVALGAKLWLVRPLGFRIDAKAVRRAGLDYWSHLDYEIAANWDELCERLSGRRFWFFSKKARRVYSEVEFFLEDVLVFGSETRGVPDTMLTGNPDRTLRVPITDKVRSLNLGNTVALAAYETFRQWGHPQDRESL